MAQPPYHCYAIILPVQNITACFFIVCIAIQLHNRKKYTNKCKMKIKFSLLVGTSIKVLKQAAEMKHELSACI